MSLVCFDNMVLIWGLRPETANPQDKAKIARADQLIKRLGSDGSSIMIPAIVVTEFLIGTAGKEVEFLGILSKRFQIVPFDASAALIAAKLFLKHKNVQMQSGNNSNGNSSTKVKSDIQLVATAISRKVGVIYSHDGFVRTLCGYDIQEHVTSVEELPEAQQPVELGLDYTSDQS